MADLGWQVDGPAEGPLLVMGSSLGTTRSMWRIQVEPLSQHLRVLRYDHRGHGESAVPPGPYAMDDLGADLLELLDAVAPGERVHYAGLSLGGMVGMWLAIHAPERVGRLALVSTSAHMPPAEQWTTRAETVLTNGMEAIADVEVVPREHARRTIWIVTGAAPAPYAASVIVTERYDRETLMVLGIEDDDMAHRMMALQIVVDHQIFTGRDPAALARRIVTAVNDGIFAKRRTLKPRP